MPDSIAQWLEKLGLGHYAGVFDEHAIELEHLRDLDHEILKDIGIQAAGHRITILNAAAEPAELESPAAADNPKILIDNPVPDAVGEAERRQLTVMFCDLVGSTELSTQLELEEYRELLRAYQRVCGQAIEHYEGYISRYEGDGLLVYFCYPTAHEDDAERAVRAALEVLDNITELNNHGALPRDVKIAARMGIATGRVVVGDLLGDGYARQSTIIGQTPNLAARLQSIAAPNTIVLARSTEILLGGLFDCESLGTRTLKGFSKPVPAWQVLRARETESRFEAMHPALLSPFVGRVEELELLQHRWRQCTQGEGQVMVLSGEAGIGKSRIVKKLRETLEHDTHLTIYYQCSPYHVNTALYPIIHQLERASGFEYDDTPPAKISKLRDFLALTGLAEDLPLPLLGNLLSIPAHGQYLPLEMPPGKLKESIFQGILHGLEHLAERQPLLIIFEDAHWVDPSTLELLQHLVEHSQSLPILLVVTCRPEFDSTWSHYPHTTYLTLNRLGRAEVTEMITNLEGTVPLPADIVEQIAGKTDGVALFVEEVTRNVVESGSLYIPSTLQDSLMERLDRLVLSKEVAQIGAIIGREFSYKLISSVLPLDTKKLKYALNELTESGLLFCHATSGSLSYRFKHALVQDVAYGSLLKEKKAYFHARIAAVLEQWDTPATPLEPNVIAHHFNEARQFEKAIQYLRQSAELAIQCSANIEATASLELALDANTKTQALDARVSTEIALRELLCIALESQSWGSPKIEENLYKLRALRIERGDRDELFSVLHGICGIHLISGRLALARTIAEEMHQLVEQSDSGAFAVLSEHSFGMCDFFSGEFPSAIDHFKNIFALYDSTVGSVTARYYVADSSVVAHCMLAWSYSMLDRKSDAEQAIRHAAEIAGDIKHLFSTVYELSITASCYQALGDVECCLEYASQAVELSQENGYTYWEAWARILRGWALAHRDDRDQGVHELEMGISLYVETGSKQILPYAKALLADALYACGRIEAGRDAIRAAAGDPHPVEVCFFAQRAEQIATRLEAM